MICMYIYRVLTPTTLATMQCDAQWTRRMQVVRMASIVSPGGERTRALREQAHFPVYPPTLFHSPPDDISKMINTTTTERTVYHGLQRDTSCARFVSRAESHPDSRVFIMLRIGIENLEAL